MQGKGLGSKLFSAMLEWLKQCPKQGVFWRADPKNDMNDWYVKQVDKCGGGFHHGTWVVYWVGNFGGDVNKVVSYAENKPKTLNEVVVCGYALPFERKWSRRKPELESRSSRSDWGYLGF